MAVSAFDLFKIGIGPSSSHTVGPMRAAARFAHRLERHGLLDTTALVRAQLYGSLGATGRGHGTGMAVVLGLEGSAPDTIDTVTVPARVAAIDAARRLRLAGRHEVAVEVEFSDRLSHDDGVPFHVNNVRFSAFDADGQELDHLTVYSVGGGFIVDDELLASPDPHHVVPEVTVLPHPFRTGTELLEVASSTGLTIAGVVRENERKWRTDAQIDAGLLRIWGVMHACVERGITTEGELPGGLRVRRRARAFHRTPART